MHGPEILLCVDGHVRVSAIDGSSRVPLERGQAAFVQASVGRYTVDGDGTLFRAAVGAL